MVGKKKSEQSLFGARGDYIESEGKFLGWKEYYIFYMGWQLLQNISYIYICMYIYTYIYMPNSSNCTHKSVLNYVNYVCIKWVCKLYPNKTVIKRKICWS